MINEIDWDLAESTRYPTPTEKMTMDELESRLFPENEKSHGKEVIFNISRFRYHYCNGILETYRIVDNQLIDKYECR